MATSQRRYTNVTVDEFESFLGSFTEFSRVQDTDAKEAVYSIPLPHPDLEVRIFSTLNPDGNARGCGDDAIRSVIWHTTEGCPVGGREKTLRIQTWRQNLKPKVEDLMTNWRQRFHGNCPECSGVLQLRDGEYGEFLGCSNYPRCKHTEDT